MLVVHDFQIKKKKNKLSCQLIKTQNSLILIKKKVQKELKKKIVLWRMFLSGQKFRVIK